MKDRTSPRPPGITVGIVPFAETLAAHSLTLTRDAAETLQINVGYRCNQACQHCHHEAGPQRSELMDADTVEQVIAYARRSCFASVDITGGAPELNPHLPALITGLAPVTRSLLVRSNLTVLCEGDYDELLTLYRRYGVTLQVSLPSLTPEETNRQRGAAAWEQSLVALRKLNALGYGQADAGLEMYLAVNPLDEDLAQPQAQVEACFRETLLKQYGIAFTQARTLTNVPLGRFRARLRRTGRLEAYLTLLATHFNPRAVAGLMCRTLVSVAWDGYLYDCDFHQARGLPLGGRRTHITELEGPPPPGSPIVTADHCYACTAGLGFT